MAGVDHVVAEGIADPQALFLEGWSWGGYLTTLIAGLHPDRWRAACAGIPVGDYVAAHYESAPTLRAWDLATMGGSPMELPELYRERNPMTYVDRVKAPMLLIAGEHDSRCPLGQVMVYAHALRARGHEVDVHLYGGGHHALRGGGEDRPRAHDDRLLPAPPRRLTARDGRPSTPRPATLSDISRICSTISAFASVVTSPSARPWATSRSSRRMILPDRVFGKVGR